MFRVSGILLCIWRIGEYLVGSEDANKCHDWQQSPTVVKTSNLISSWLMLPRSKTQVLNDEIPVFKIEIQLASKTPKQVDDQEENIPDEPDGQHQETQRCRRSWQCSHNYTKKTRISTKSALTTQFPHTDQVPISTICDAFRPFSHLHPILTAIPGSYGKSCEPFGDFSNCECSRF